MRDGHPEREWTAHDMTFFIHGDDAMPCFMEHHRNVTNVVIGTRVDEAVSITVAASLEAEAELLALLCYFQAVRMQCARIIRGRPTLFSSLLIPCSVTRWCGMTIL